MAGPETTHGADTRRYATGDLTAAADVLGRAADRLEELVGRAQAPGEEQWFTAAELTADGDIHERDAALIEAFSPYVVAALVPTLRMAADAVNAESATRKSVGWYGAGLADGLLAFARRVLREETP